MTVEVQKLVPESRGDVAALQDLLALAAESLRRSRASELMTDAVIHGGVAEMARAASSLATMPVAIVDQFGHLQAGAAEGQRVEWDRVPMPSFQDLSAAASAGKSLRLRQTLVAAAADGTEVLGGVLMTDAAGTADPFAVYVLERSAVLLSGELAHRRELARLQTRLRGEFVFELLDGMDNEEACRRAASLGHDLQLPHRAVVIRCEEPAHPLIDSALRHAIRPPGQPLVGHRTDLVVAIVPDEMEAQGLHEALKRIRPHVSSSVESVARFSSHRNRDALTLKPFAPCGCASIRKSPTAQQISPILGCIRSWRNVSGAVLSTTSSSAGLAVSSAMTRSDKPDW